MTKDHGRADAPKRILFVLLWRSAPYAGMTTWGSSALTERIDDPGAKPLSHGLSNSAGFVVDMLNDAGIEAKLVHVASDNDIWKEIAAFDPTDVILEALWARPKKIDDLQPLFPHVRFTVRCHSSTPFLAHDTFGFKWAQEFLRKPGVAVAPNDPRHLKELRFLASQLFPGWSEEHLHRKVPYLPNYYPDHETCRAPNPHDHGYIDIGCFGAARPFKNMVGQALAAMMFAAQIGRSLRFHINGDRIECGGGPTIKNLDWVFEANPTAELVRHDWMPHHAFHDLVGAMDIVMQVSFAETFCIVAADAAGQGVPIVGSREIPWLPDAFCADPTSPDDMIRVLRHAWDTRFSNRLRDPARVALRRYAHNTREIWLDHFS